MATLLKFKLLATQCTTAKSPSRNPPSSSSSSSSSAAASRRRPTLRKLLARSPSRAGSDRTGGDRAASAEERNRKGLLRDLLLSSPPPPPLDGERTAEIGRGFRPVGSAGPFRRGRRFGPAGFRYRVMVRRMWRPALVSIPE